MSSVDVSPFLLDTSEKYHIEYRRFLSNHVAHGIIALGRLGASKDRIQQFVDWYAGNKLEPKSDYEREFAKEGEDFSDISKVPKGNRIRFYPILDLIEKEIEQNGGDYRKSVTKHFPEVSDGLEASLFHGLIQLGYGIAADCKKTVAEGIAYLYHSFAPAYTGDPETSSNRSIGAFGTGTVNPVDVLQKIREDEKLKNAMEETFKTEEIQSRDVGGLQQKLLAIYLSSNKEVQKYVDSLKLPDGIQLDNLDVDALANWVVDLSFIVYSASEVKNDFVLLHGVTSAWSLKLILPFIADQKQEVLRAVRTFLMTLVAVYVARGCYRINLGDLQGHPDQVDEDYWTKVKAEQVDRVGDEHFYKLVQVAYDMWKVNPKSTSLYVCSAKHCMSNNMFLNPDMSYPVDERKAEMTTKQLEDKMFGTPKK